MRVITGSARGRRLKELKGMDTRPTTDQVKEGMFNILQFDIEGRRVLDLFAGTGQLGIEALSRGAASAVFVEARKDAAALVRENLALCGMEDRSRCVLGDALGFLSSLRERFDLIFLDPPYAMTEAYETATRMIMEEKLLSKDGILLSERISEAAPAYAEGLILTDTRVYRDTRVDFLQVKEQ